MTFNVLSYTTFPTVNFGCHGSPLHYRLKELDIVTSLTVFKILRLKLVHGSNQSYKSQFQDTKISNYDVIMTSYDLNDIVIDSQA